MCKIYGGGHLFYSENNTSWHIDFATAINTLQFFLILFAHVFKFCFFLLTHQHIYLWPEIKDLSFQSTEFKDEEKK